jgi:hypothetical protein
MTDKQNDELEKREYALSSVTTNHVGRFEVDQVMEQEEHAAREVIEVTVTAIDLNISRIICNARAGLGLLPFSS